MKILITGSEGLLGKLTVDALRKEHELVLLDKDGNPKVDLLKDEIKSYFTDIETVVHFAANPRPWISPEEAKENIDMTYNVLEACRKAGVKRIAYASSINVYDMKNLFGNDVITAETLVHPNTKVDWEEQRGGLHYPISKIVSESLIRSYHQAFGIEALCLRFGCVTPHNRPYTNEPEDYAIWLSRGDFKEVIKRAINYRGFASFPVVSNNSEEFVDLKSLERELRYTPKDDSENYKI